MRLLIIILIAFLLTSKVFSQERLTDVKSGNSSSNYSLSKHNDSLFLAEVTKLGVINIYSIDARTDEKKVLISYQTVNKFNSYPTIFFQYPYLSFSINNEVSIFDFKNKYFKTLAVAEPNERVYLYTTSADEDGLILSVYDTNQERYHYKILYFNGEIEELPSEKVVYLKKSKNKILNYYSENGDDKYYLFDLNTKTNIFLNSTKYYSNRAILIDSTCYFSTDSALYMYVNNDFEKIKDLPLVFYSYSEMYQVDSLIYNVIPINYHEIHVTVINTKRQNLLKEFVIPVSKDEYTARSIRISDIGYSYLENNQIRIIPNLEDTSKIVKGNTLNYILGSSVYNGKFYLFTSFDSILIYDFEGVLLSSLRLSKSTYISNTHFHNINDNLFLFSNSTNQQKIWRINKTNHTFYTIDIADQFDTGADHYPIRFLNNEVVLESSKNIYKIVDKLIIPQFPNDIARNLLVKEGESYSYIEKTGSFNYLKEFDGKKSTTILAFHELIETRSLSVLENYYFLEGYFTYHSFISKKDNELTLSRNKSGLKLSLEFENKLFLCGRNGIKLANEEKLIYENEVRNLFILENQLFAISTSIYKYNRIDSTFEEVEEINLYDSNQHKLNPSLYLFAERDKLMNYSFTTFNGKSVTNIDLPYDIKKYEVYDDILYLEYSQNGKQIGMLYDVLKKKSLYSIEIEVNQRFFGFIKNQLESVLIMYNVILKEYQIIKLNQDYILEHNQIIENTDHYSGGSLDIINKDIFLYLSIGIFSYNLEKQEWVNQINSNISKITEVISKNNTIYFWGEESLTGGQYYKYQVKNNEVSPGFIPTPGFSIFPNPTTGSISFKWTINKQIQARIYNSTGQLVKKANLITNSFEQHLDIEKLPVGIYFIEITAVGSKEKRLGKFMKI